MLGDDRRNVGTDVGRLGEQRRVGGAPRLEAVARVAEARQHHVVVPRPGTEADERDAVLIDATRCRPRRSTADRPRRASRRPASPSASASRRARRAARSGRRRAATSTSPARRSPRAERRCARRSGCLRVAQAIDGPTARGRRRGAEPGSEREPARRAQPPQERPPFHARGRVHQTWNPRGSDLPTLTPVR